VCPYQHLNLQHKLVEILMDLVCLSQNLYSQDYCSCLSLRFCVSIKKKYITKRPFNHTTVLSPRSTLSYPPSMRPAATEAHLEPPSSSSRGQYEDELEDAVIHVTRYADGSTPRCTPALARTRPHTAHTHQCVPRTPVCTFACIGLEIRFKG
jgi:hypothetical protein